MRWRVGALFAACLLSTAALPALAQDDSGGGSLADVSGPGQAVSQPAAQCPRTIACQYAEENNLPGGYRLQSLRVCGANCTSQYWVAAIAGGQLLLEIDPVRGGAIVAVNRSGMHPSLRVIMPMWGPNEPACCPSTYTDIRYDWDSAADTLVAGDAQSTPADQFPGFDAARQELGNEGWVVASL